MEITDDQLLEVIKNAPLVSIDIIVKNKDGKILLGFRNNEPAKNTWFIPGGRKVHILIFQREVVN